MPTLPDLNNLIIYGLLGFFAACLILPLGYYVVSAVWTFTEIACIRHRDRVRQERINARVRSVAPPYYAKKEK